MEPSLLWPTLAILAGAGATIPAVRNPTTRTILYWLVLSPIAMVVVSVFYLTSIR